MTTELKEKVCKCCGRMKSIDMYSKGNNRRPIGVCKECRRRQQTISNYRDIDVLQMTPTQASRYTEAIKYMEECKKATGFETGKYSSSIGMPAHVSLNANTSVNMQNINTLYTQAQQRRKAAESMGMNTTPPTEQLVREASLEFIVECGYTQKECFKILDDIITADDPDYDALWEKLILIPA